MVCFVTQVILDSFPRGMSGVLNLLKMRGRLTSVTPRTSPKSENVVGQWLDKRGKPDALVESSRQQYSEAVALLLRPEETDSPTVSISSGVTKRYFRRPDDPKRQVADVSELQLCPRQADSYGPLTRAANRSLPIPTHACRTYRSKPKYWLDTAARKASREHPQPFKSESHPGRALTVLELGALSDLDNITVRIADVAANLAVLGYWLRDELGSSTFPQFIARLDIRNAEVHKAVDVILVGDAERYRRLIRGRPASNVQNHPDIRRLEVPRRVAVTQAQNASAEDLFVVASRSLDVGDGEKMRDADPLSRGHLIALLFDLYAAN
jgi:hypothetical protein